MPLPESHLDSLQRQMQVHEERLALLRGQQDALASEMGTDITAADAVAQERGQTAREKKGKAGSPRDPNRKVRSAEWIASRRAMLQREIRIHERLMELGRDAKVRDALGDLANNREFARQASLDPKGAARQRGIDLPANMTVDLAVEPDRVRLRVAYYEELFPFVIDWDSASGFSSPDVPGRSEPRARSA